MNANEMEKLARETLDYLLPKPHVAREIEVVLSVLRAVRQSAIEETRQQDIEELWKVRVRLPECVGTIAVTACVNALEALAAQPLLHEPTAHAPSKCHCQPGQCMAPKIMGFQTPCLDPEKAAQQKGGKG